jgi:hypothetical protein
MRSYSVQSPRILPQDFVAAALAANYSVYGFKMLPCFFVIQETGGKRIPRQHLYVISTQIQCCLRL